MFLIATVIIILLIVFFWNTIYTMLKYLATGKSTNAIIWFVSLLILNIIILVFILVFYYYKSNTPGKDGMAGDTGFPGYDGDGGIINMTCNNNNG